MSKTERFEMRLDLETANAIDAWRDENMAGAARSQAVRELIRIGLSSATSTQLRFSDGEKTLMTLMRDIFRHIGAPTEKVDILLDGFSTGNHWAVDLEMGNLYNSASTSFEDVPFVLATLEMWNTFELAFENFSEEDRAIVLADTDNEIAMREVGKQPEIREIKFEGFSATNESNLVQIASFIVEKMHRFPRFNGRNLSSTKKETYQHNRKKLEYYDQLRSRLAGRLLSPQEVRDFSLVRSAISFEEVKAVMKKNGQWSDDNNCATF